MTNKTSTRVQLELPEKSMARLKLLKDKTEAASYAEVIKNALRLYESVLQRQDEGQQFFLKDADGKEVEYQIFL